MVVFLSVLQPAFISLVSLAGSCSLRSARILFGLTQSVGVLTGNYFVEGRLGVKCKMMIEGWLKSGDGWMIAGERCPHSGRKASIKYEIAGTGEEFSGEDFQNTGTLIVVRSAVFSKSSAQIMHLARDAYNACSQRAGRRQVLFFQYILGLEPVCAVVPDWYSEYEAGLGLPILPSR